MLERWPGGGGGRELFFHFVPASVRHRSDPRGVPVLSGELVAEMGDYLQGPALEVSWPGPTVFRGLLRAIKHVDGLLAVSLVPTRRTEAADKDRIDTVLQVAAEVGFDGPLVVVARAPHLDDLDDGGIERMAEVVMEEVDQGFTSVSFRPQDIAVDGAARVAKAAAGLLEQGIGVELELDRGPGAGLLLAAIDELGLPVAAVRGARPGDECCGGLYVADPLKGPIPEDIPCRVVLDGFVLKAILRALPKAEGEAMLHRADGDASEALRLAAPVIEELDDVTRMRLEAMTYGHVVAACKSLGAEYVASDLLEALAHQMNAG